MCADAEELLSLRFNLGTNPNSRKDLSLTSSYNSKKNIDLIRSIENQLI